MVFSVFYFPLLFSMNLVKNANVVLKVKWIKDQKRRAGGGDILKKI